MKRNWKPFWQLLTANPNRNQNQLNQFQHFKRELCLMKHKKQEQEREVLAQELVYWQIKFKMKKKIKNYKKRKRKKKKKNQQNVEKQNTFNSEYQNLIQFHTRERFNNFRIYLTSAEYQVDFRLPHYEKINWTPEKDIPCFRLVCNKIVRDLREEESTLDSKNEKTNELIKKLRRQQMTVSRKY